jgi:hypothetical protein
MLIRSFDSNGVLISETGSPDPPRKSVYTKDEFIAKIPKAKIRAIKTAAETNDDINMWLFNLPMVNKIDLNTLPDWFTEGVDAMVTEGVITQNQADAFLEREPT